MSVLLAVAMGALALAPAVALLVPRRFGERGGSLLSAAGAALLVIVGVSAAVGSSHPVVNLGGWIGFGHSALRIDGLAGIFLTLTGLTGGAVALAHAELPAGRLLTTFAGALLLFVAVAIGADNGFLFFMAWEAISVCVYLIASAGRDPQDLVRGYLTGGLAKIGGGALLAAFGLLYADTHSFSLAVWAHASLSNGERGIVFLLFLACFATKVGLVPLQGGLPAGYDASPRLGAASLSVALCAGFYGLWRFEFDILGPLPTWCGDALLIIGAVTAVAGITYALTRNNLREFLGYSTVEHAGIALVGFAVALLGHAAHNQTLAAAGLLAATLHVCAHNLSKTLALITIDRVDLASGHRGIDPLGGLARLLPVSAVALGIASLTLAAIPPLGGFVSEWFTFQALLQAFRMPALLSQLLCALAGATLALTAGLGVLAFAKYYSFIFLGHARTSSDEVREPSRWPLGVGGLGVVLVFLGAVAPWEIHAIGAGLTHQLGFNLANVTISHPLVLGPVFQNFSVLAPTWLYIVFPAYVLLATLIAFGADRRQRVRREPVWVTGSAAELSAVQYRPSAYSNPMRVILRGPLGYRSQLKASTPQNGAARYRLERQVVLAVDRFVYTPLTTFALNVSARVRRFQSGRLSSYLLYMLVALIVALSLVPILR